jgi:SagB-type dehydrogenase family enzyme
LAEPQTAGSISLEEALAGRRSVRQFTGQGLELTQISQLAWAGQGITEPQRGLRTAPSAGAAYPITLYFATAGGLFAYNPLQHSLEQSSELDLRGRLAAAAGKHEAVALAGCDIIVAGSVRKLTAQFGKKARRYMLLEAGHIAQNIALQAVSLGLGSVPIAGFDVREVSKTCRIPKSLEPLYIIAVGHPVEQPEQAAAEPSPPPKRAVLIIASQGFRDEQLAETQLLLNEAGVETIVACSRAGIVPGVLGGQAEAVLPLSELIVDEYDAVVFLGGVGAREYFDQPLAFYIARAAVAKGKVLAAISIAPSILANAGVLKNVVATGYLTERERLQTAGAQYTGTPVERDGQIVTARDTPAVRMFAEAILDALTDQ